MNATRARILGALLGGVLLGMTPMGARAETLATYDDWTTAATIRADRWIGGSDFGHERRREVDGDTLRVRFRREGGTDSDAGATGFFSNRLNFRNPLGVTAMEAELRVRDLTLTGCPVNPTASITRAATLDLNRISDLPPDTVSAPGDITGDHIARLEVRRLSDSTDHPGVLTVRALLFRCNNPSCSSSSVVGAPVTLGQVRAHQWFRVRLAWDPEASEFRAGLDNAPDVSVPYPPGMNARPANSPLAAIRIQHVPANCTMAAGGPTIADADLEVRIVRTNASAVIP